MTTLVRFIKMLMSSQQRLGWLLAASLLALGLHAESESIVYTGSIGHLPIVMKLEFSRSHEISGRYFYRKYGKDLTLSGTLNTPDVMTLTETTPGEDDTPAASMTLKKGPAGGWQGTWKSVKGQTLAVAVSPVPSSVKEEADADSVYQNLRLESRQARGPKLVKGKQQVFMGHTLQWWQDPESTIAYFEITSGYSPEILKRLNEKLQARFWDEVSNGEECSENAGPTGGEYKVTFTPEFLSAEVISVNVFVDYYCGGAHPDFGEDPINLRVADGLALTLEDVLWVGKGTPVHYKGNDADFGAYSKYRDEVFAPWIRDLFLKLYPTEMNEDEHEDSCSYADTEIWNFPSWYFTPEGIHLGPIFARAARACEGPEWSVLPYRFAKKHPGKVRLSLP
jgi:hypothetical protein